MTFLALLATTVALQAGPQRPAQGSTARPAPPARTLTDSVASAERHFFAVWYSAWRTSDAPRRRTTEGPWRDPSKADLACNPNPAIYVPDNAWGLNYKLRLIASAQSKLAVCPNWFPPAGYYINPAKIIDERLGIDGGLDPRFKGTILIARQRVIDVLDSAVKLEPANTMFTGQLVRFLVDQGDLDRAQEVVRDCKTLPWWCNALTGYILTRRGSIDEAETWFTASADALVPADRCKWTDVSALLDSAGRRAYAKLNCTERDAFNDRFWWLVDPLWIEPGNDRRVEQFARQVIATLHAAMGRDERYTWTPTQGGDALSQTINRYGWPTYTYWGQILPPGLPPPSSMLAHISGPTAPLPQTAATAAALEKPATTNPVIPGMRNIARPIDWTPYDEFFAELRANAMACDAGGCAGLDIQRVLNLADPPNIANPALTSTIEYSVGRVHLVPHTTTLDNPFTAKNSDWDLNAPRYDPVAALEWWPWEHYASPHALMQFEDQQVTLLRRQGGSLLAYATALGGTDLHRNPSDTVRAKLVASTGPDAISMIAEKRQVIASTLTFLENITSNPMMIGVEIPAGVDSQAAGRARFGIRPRPPLSTMARGAIDISDPVFLAAPTSLDALPNDIDAVLPLMLGSTRLAQGVPRVGVYWETYGIAATDTVGIAVRVQRTTPLTMYDRLGLATGLGDNPNTPVTFEWKEPDPRHQARTLPGTVPIQMRSVVLDISALTRGEYTLEILVTKLGREPVRGTREFTVR